jgi:uncharacterized protein YkwD
MKKLILLFLLISGTCFADNTAIVQDDGTIIIPDFYFQGQLYNHTAVLKYDANKNTWYLFSLTKNADNVFITEINKYRASGAPCSPGGLPRVYWDGQLAVAARAHSLDMANNNFMGHIGTDGSTPWDRVARTSFVGTPMGENVAAGQPDIQSAVAAWINSHSGHCESIMSPQANVMGYGVQTNPPTQYRIYHTMLTGRR